MKSTQYLNGSEPGFKIKIYRGVHSTAFIYRLSRDLNSPHDSRYFLLRTTCIQDINLEAYNILQSLFNDGQETFIIAIYIPDLPSLYTLYYQGTSSCLSAFKIKIYQGVHSTAFNL